MKKINTSFLISSLIIVFSMSTLPGSSQTKEDEKKNIKQPPRLLVLDETQTYSLQNSSELIKKVFSPTP